MCETQKNPLVVMCDICKHNPAMFDSKTFQGPWANLCLIDFAFQNPTGCRFYLRGKNKVVGSYSLIGKCIVCDKDAHSLCEICHQNVCDVHYEHAKCCLVLHANKLVKEGLTNG